MCSDIPYSRFLVNSDIKACTIDREHKSVISHQRMGPVNALPTYALRKSMCGHRMESRRNMPILSTAQGLPSHVGRYAAC
jgi:hypothetical protein